MGAILSNDVFHTSGIVTDYYSASMSTNSSVSDIVQIEAIVLETCVNYIQT